MFPASTIDECYHWQETWILETTTTSAAQVIGQSKYDVFPISFVIDSGNDKYQDNEEQVFKFGETWTCS